MSAIKRKRSKNFSEYEKTLLKNLCINETIIEDKRSDQNVCQQKNNAWAKISAAFNSEEKITKRETKELKVNLELNMYALLLHIV